MEDHKNPNAEHAHISERNRNEMENGVDKMKNENAKKEENRADQNHRADHARNDINRR